MMALGAIRAARQQGLRVPQDVSVVGFDDSPLIAFTDPPLTTIRQPVQAMGQAAYRRAMDEYSLEVWMKRHHALYCEVLSSNGHGKSQ